MCYAYQFVFDKEQETWHMVLWKEFQRLFREGKIKTSEGLPDEQIYIYARNGAPIITRETEGFKGHVMHWDLIPRWFKNKEELSIEQVIKKKNSKAEGFSTFNARSEDIESKASYRSPWREGKRCIFPGIAQFKERPNEKKLPKDFEKKEYNIELDGVFYFGGLFENWKSKDGTILSSCTLITLNSAGHTVMESVHHNRMPLILSQNEAEEWLADHTTPKQAKEMVKQFSHEKMSVPDLEKQGKLNL